MAPIIPSRHLAQVRYEIRGALARRARELECGCRQIVHLNIGNPGRFGFRAPESLQAAVANGLARSDAYCQEQGLSEAREAIAARQVARGARLPGIDRVFIGNGVSELIDMALRALLDPGDEVLIPSPDYPLWSAATILNGGQPRHYPCRPGNAHLPDADEIEAMVTPRTRALVLINPNNPTGAVYPRALLQRLVDVASRHGLLLMSDEIYDGIVYDEAVFEPLAPLAGDVPCVSFCGLSKVHRACGYRVGWMSLSGSASTLTAYRDALQLLAALRLCANVPGQWAIKPALESDTSIEALVRPGGRLYRARLAVLDGVAASNFFELVAPMGALYAFPSVRQDVLPDFDDDTFALRLLEEESVLLAPGCSFNTGNRRHLRLTLLPEPAQLTDVLQRMERVLQRMRVRAPTTEASAA